MGRILKAKIIGCLANKILTPNRRELVEATEGRVRDVAASPNRRRRHRRDDTPKTIGSREIPHVARSVRTVPRQRKRLENPASSKSCGQKRETERNSERWKSIAIFYTTYYISKGQGIFHSTIITT